MSVPAAHLVARERSRAWWQLRRTGMVTNAPPVVDQRRYPPMRRFTFGRWVFWLPARTNA